MQRVLQITWSQTGLPSTQVPILLRKRYKASTKQKHENATICLICSENGRSLNGTRSLSFCGVADSLLSASQPTAGKDSFPTIEAATVDSGGTFVSWAVARTGAITAVAKRHIDRNIPNEVPSAINTDFFMALSFCPCFVHGKERGRKLFRVSREALEKPCTMHERQCAQLAHSPLRRPVQATFQVSLGQPKRRTLRFVCA